MLGPRPKRGTRYRLWLMLVAAAMVPFAAAAATKNPPVPRPKPAPPAAAAPADATPAATAARPALPTSPPAAAPPPNRPGTASNQPATAPRPPTAASRALIDGFRVLSAGDVAKYRAVFVRQRENDWAGAAHATAGIENTILMGHVLAQRFLNPKSPRPNYSELADWLHLYRDHPDAGRIYRLAMARLPKGERSPPAPQVNQIAVSPDDEGERIDFTIPSAPVYRSPEQRSPAQARDVAAIQRRVRTLLADGNFVAAEQAITSERSRVLDRVETDQLTWELAARLFYAGIFDQAYALASRAANRSRQYVEIADWTAGLSAWRLGRYDDARRHFEALAQSTAASNWNVSAGAYWAARASLVTRRPEQVNRWLAIAAKTPHAFYGLLASALLGEDPTIGWETPPLDEARLRDLGSNPGVRRTVALAEVGQTHLAERELRQLLNGSDRAAGELMLALADRLGLASVAMRLARVMFEPGDRYHAAAAYPVPQFPFVDGYNLDRALVFAFIRQESEFNAFARSPVGARGLMQLMPNTASFVAGDKGLRDGRRNDLYEPDTNLNLGQRYLSILLDDELVKGNLFYLAAAYNAGPGNLNKWLRRLPETDDPLMVIESLPARETRLFVERVLANYWIYQLRLGHSLDSLQAATGGWSPIYAGQDDKPQRGNRNTTRR
ncbi:MAG: lytic transglycosylase domain-containing protein [Alphaproteobacteria bacterium]|nr:lytic transglycosylase domain-containing protein [Alphaproteobacteria bacterium]